MNEEKFRHVTILREQIQDMEERLVRLNLLLDLPTPDKQFNGLYTENILCIRASEDFYFYHHFIARCVEKIEGLLEEKRKLYEEL